MSKFERLPIHTPCPMTDSNARIVISAHSEAIEGLEGRFDRACEAVQERQTWFNNRLKALEGQLRRAQILGESAAGRSGRNEHDEG